MKRSIGVVLREPPERRLRFLALMLILVHAVGTTGYVIIEDWPVVDALYMTVTTITTVGFGEIHPLSRTGRIFTIGLIAVGLTGIWYALSVLVGLMIEGRFSQEWERRRMEQRLSGIQDHFIVCGYGRVGRQIAAQLQRYRRPVVVVDRDPVALAEAASDGLLTVQGDATEDDVLKEAGIERARGLITAVATDADNVFVTLSARALRPDLPIVARANVEDAAPKLQRAGATHVVSPYAIAGRQMASLAVRPSTVSFVETLLHGTKGDLLLEDLTLAPGSAMVGLKLSDLLHRCPGILVLAVQRAGEMLAPPAGDLVLEPGDVLAIVGTEAQLRALEEACQSAVPQGR